MPLWPRRVTSKEELRETRNCAHRIRQTSCFPSSQPFVLGLAETPGSILGVVPQHDIPEQACHCGRQELEVSQSAQDSLLVNTVRCADVSKSLGAPLCRKHGVPKRV